MMPRMLTSTAAALLLLTAPALAQTARVHDPSGGRQEGSVRVQDSIAIFFPGPTGDSEEAQKLRDRARRAVYEMAARGCDVLREVLARECRLESISAGVNRQYGRQQEEGVSVNGSMSYQITLK